MLGECVDKSKVYSSVRSVTIQLNKYIHNNHHHPVTAVQIHVYYSNQTLIKYST